MKKILALSFSLLLLPLFAEAQSFGFYVDKNYSGEEKGTIEAPFKTISSALQVAEKSRPGLRSIHILKGEYEEQLTLSDSIKLFGEEKETTIIKMNPTSTLELSGNNILKNLTISGGMAGITVKGATIIEDCVIRDAKKKGVDLTEGNTLVKISNSKISQNGGKGVYVQKGRWIVFNGNTVSANEGEGYDIRQNIFGLISQNDIFGNTESGIEILTSASDVTIKNNAIKNNLASGIANQSYPDMPDLGKINIIENSITNNGKYGVYCGAPSGGSKTKTFFSESIALKNNINSENKGKPVAGACHFERQTAEFLAKIPSDIESRVLDESNNMEVLYKKQTEIDTLLLENENMKNYTEDMNFFKKMFLGVNPKDLEIISENIHKTQVAVEDLKKLQFINTDMQKSVLETETRTKQEISTIQSFSDKSRRFNTIFWIPIKFISLFH